MKKQLKVAGFLLLSALYATSLASCANSAGSDSGFLLALAVPGGGSDNSNSSSTNNDNSSNANTTTPDSNTDNTDSNQNSSKTLSLSDKPVGYASLGNSYVTSGTKTVVTTKAQLVAAVAKGGIIVIDGMIDMSEGMLPESGKTMLDSTPGLDALVRGAYGKYATYNEFVNAYAASCDLLTEDDTEYNASKDPFKKNSKVKNSSLRSELVALNKLYGDKIKINLVSGTTLVGKGSNSGIRGGSIQLNSVKNIQIRNLKLQDACDPFPHHEVNSNANATDGYNAQWDCVTVQGSCENIWIDHCTLEDTLTLGKVKTGGSDEEKWQTFDGLCDMKNESTNITVSNCLFKNHDKTMLIGSSKSDGNNSKRFITLYGNYFLNCGQRLPMVRNTTIHIFNNYFDASSPHYSQQYAVGCRENCIVYAENNYFGSGIQYSFKDSQGKLYSTGNVDKSKSGRNSSLTGTTLFKDGVGKYSYTAISAEDAMANAKENAGAGYSFAP